MHNELFILVLGDPVIPSLQLVNEILPLPNTYINMEILHVAITLSRIFHMSTFPFHTLLKNPKVTKLYFSLMCKSQSSDESSLDS